MLDRTANASSSVEFVVQPVEDKVIGFRVIDLMPRTLRRQISPASAKEKGGGARKDTNLCPGINAR